MTYSQERIDAYAQLDTAIENCVDVFESFDEGELPIGYVVIVVGARLVNEEFDDHCPHHDDDEDMVSRFTTFTKRGQMPVVTRGAVESYLDRFRRA